MRPKFATFVVLLEHMRGLIQDDWDNVMLFTGVEGVGKSTLMFEVMLALDPEFDADHVHFKQTEFLGDGPTLGPGRAYAWDEARLNRRLFNTRETKAVLNHLQDCRALNHHIGICFPREQLLDRAIVNERCRYNFDVYRRGMFRVRERRRIHRPIASDPDRHVYDWKVIGRYRFPAAKGPKWRAYLKKKEAHMREVQAEDAPAPAFDADVLGPLVAEYLASGDP